MSFSLLLWTNNHNDWQEQARWLKQYYEVQAVAEMTALRTAICQRIPDLLVGDIDRLKDGGFRWLREFRSVPCYREVPIILLADSAQEECCLEGIEAGANDYLLAPVSVRELLTRVKVNLKIACQRQSAGLQESSADELSALETLRESEAQFRQIVENASLMVWRADATGYCTYFSQSWYEFTGLTQTTALGLGWLDAVHPEERKTFQNIFLEANKRQEGFRLEYRLRGRDGKYHWAICVASPWFDDQGEFQGYIGSDVDISDRKEIEQEREQLLVELDTSQRLLSAVLQQMPEGVVVVEAQSKKIMLINDRGREILPVSQPSQLIEEWASGSLRVLSPEGQPYLFENMPLARSLLKGEVVQGEEICVQNSNSNGKIVLTNAAPIWNRSGELAAAVATFFDITERRQIEVALRESEARFRQMAETIQSVFWMRDLSNRRIVYVSPAYEQIWGYSVESLYDNPDSWLDAVHPEDREQIQRAFDEGVQVDNFDKEYRVVRPDGSVCWVRDRGFPIRNEEGKIYRVTGIAEDITARKQTAAALDQALEERNRYVNQLEQANAMLHDTLEELQLAEEELRQQNQALSVARQLAEVERVKYHNLFAFAPDGYFVTDSKGTIQEANQAAGDIVKIPTNYLHNVPLAVFFIQSDRRAFRNLLYEWHQQPQQEKLYTDALKLRCGEESIPIAITGAATRDERGQITAMRWWIQDISDRKRMEAKLEQQLAEIETIYQSAPIGLCVLDSRWHFVRINERLAQMNGFSVAEHMGRTVRELLPQLTDVVEPILEQVLATGEPVLNREIQGETPAQPGVPRSWLKSFLPLKEGDHIIGISAVCVEITERKQFEKALFEEKELAQVTLDSIGDGVITTDAQGKIRHLNPVAEHLTGWTAREAQGLPILEVFKIVDEITGEPADNPVETALCEGCKTNLAHHTVLVSRDGFEYAIEDSAAPIRSSNGEIAGVVLVFHNVTQSRNLARQLSWQATHDALTGLVNRQEFEQRLQKAIASAEKKSPHALCYLDLDQFKIVNDTCGHAAGDELLRQLTACIQQQVRASDTFARLGGDEFGLLLYRCPLPQAEKIADTLRLLIGEYRFAWQNKTFAIGASIGLVPIDRKTLTLSTVLSAADVACYAAKAKGRNRVQVYRENDLDLTRQRGEIQWIAKINQALAANRLQLYSQKILPILGHEAEHAEILLRLIDEEGKVIPPMAFIPAAERYDLMPVVDRWVITTFLAQYEAYCQQHLGENCDHRLYAINLSGASLNSDRFIDFLQEQLSQFQIPPQTVCFEITETTAITNLSQATQLIRELKQLGCQFALDDFGTGMSSLNYLKNLPVDYLKIDGSFVRNLISDRIDCTMVEYISRIGQVMKIKTIAEFVENDAILEKLRSLRIDYAQGYGIARPCPLSFS